MKDKEVIITTMNRNGKKGVVLLESIDEESGTPFFVIKFEKTGNIEVFFEGEFELV